MLFDDLKKANMEALKNKDNNARVIYSIVINKCMLLKVEKKASNQEVTDEDVLSLINKTIKELDEEISGFESANRVEQVANLKAQRAVIEGYLPKQLSKEEIENEISSLADKSMPAIMKHFKVNFAGKCDMKLVSEIARKI